MLSGNAQMFSINPLEYDDVPMHSLGTLAIDEDGRKYRYQKAGGTALVAGHTLQAPAIVANHQNVAVQAAAAAGATQVKVTLGATAATANQYSEGYLVINDAAGEGHMYKIKGHAAVLSSGVMTVNLYDKVKVALTTSSEACLIANPYSGSIDFPTTTTGMFVGIAPFAVPIGKYFWGQTGGVASMLAGGAIGVGLGVAVPGSAAGSGSVMAATLAQIGHALQAAVDTEYRAVFLTVD